MKSTTTCAICNSEEVSEIRGRFASAYNGVPVNIDDAEMYQCKACGEKFFSPGQARSVSIAVKNQVRQRFNLLSPQEIIEIRKKLELSQGALEHLFGLGPKVVTRWETGRVVQGKTADVALRLLAMAPDLLTKLGQDSERRKAIQEHA